MHLFDRRGRGPASRRLWLVLVGLVVCWGCGDPQLPSGPDSGLDIPPGKKPLLGISEPNASRRTPPPSTADAIAALVAASGAASQRVNVDWSIVEPQAPGRRHSYRFAPFDAMYRADLRHGVRPLLVVLNAPRWAWDALAVSGRFVNNPPSEGHLRNWQAFVAAVVRRYPRAVGIEIWNEPNLATFWGAGSGVGVRPDPDRYTRLLRQSYLTVKSRRPRLPVIGGALSSAQRPSRFGDIPLAEFAEAMFDEGAAAYMDAMSLHPYPGAGGVAQTLALVEQVRRVRDEAGARTPLWLTEVGVTTTGPNAASELEQARELLAVCEAVSAKQDVDALYVHNLVEQTRPGAGIERGYGLVQARGGGRLRPKPAFGVLSTAFSSSRGCAP